VPLFPQMVSDTIEIVDRWQELEEAWKLIAKPENAVC
jgi:hypothetical protein